MEFYATGSLDTAIDAFSAVVSHSESNVEFGNINESPENVIGVVAGAVDDDIFSQANAKFDQWIAIQEGGIAGANVGDVHGSIAGFTPATGCYQCLTDRISDSQDNSDRSTHTGGSFLLGALAAVTVLNAPSQVFGHIIEYPQRRRRFTPSPACGCLSPPSGEFELTYQDVTLEEALNRAELAVDDRVGIITNVGEVESFPAPYYLSTLSNPERFTSRNIPAQAAGVAIDWNEAYMKATGEALERHAAATYQAEDLHTDTPSELERCVPPAAFASASDDAPDQHSDTAIRWRRGINLHNENQVWIPAEAVYFPPPEIRYLYPITTGLGVGTSLTQAVVSGLTEVIERDATMIDWYASGSPPRLEIEDSTFNTLARRARAEGLEVTPLRVRHDSDIPVVSTAVYRDDWPRFAIGADAASTYTDAAIGSLSEALQNWMELRSAGKEKAATLSGKIGHYSNHPDTISEYVGPDQSISPRNPEHDPQNMGLQFLLDQISSLGLTAYASRITTVDLDSLSFEAVRVVVPAAQPLFMNTEQFSERITTVPNTFGASFMSDHPHHPYP